VLEEGGCCSRNCGCCQSRYASTKRRNGIGHCTPSCGCCAIEREFEYTKDEKQKIVDEIRGKLDDNPAYIIRMADAYFFQPREEKLENKDLHIEGKSKRTEGKELEVEEVKKVQSRWWNR